MLKIRAHKAAWCDRIELLAIDGDNIGLPLTMQRREPGTYITEPTFDLTGDAAQTLMDDLWHCGFRPSEGAGSAGSLAATERHLKDMQAIAFAALKFDKP